MFYTNLLMIRPAVSHAPLTQQTQGHSKVTVSFTSNVLQPSVGVSLPCAHPTHSEHFSKHIIKQVMPVRLSFQCHLQMYMLSCANVHAVTICIDSYLTATSRLTCTNSLIATYADLAPWRFV